MSGPIQSAPATLRLAGFNNTGVVKAVPFQRENMHLLAWFHTTNGLPDPSSTTCG